MRQFTVLFALVLLAYALPAAAQTRLDPADFLPANASFYVEVPSDEASIQRFQSLFDAAARMGNAPIPPGTSIIDEALTPAVNVMLPNVDVEQDIIPWLAGNRVGIVLYNDTTTTSSSQSPTESVLALPIGDVDAAQAFFAELATEQVSVISNTAIYEVGLSHIASSDAAIWIGSPNRVEQMIGDLADGVLSSADWYQRVKSQLPADPLVSGYINGEWAKAQMAQQNAMSSPGAPSAAVLFETVLRLHPAESALEDAFLQFPDFIGAGFAMDYVDGRLDITAAATLDATYPAPTLTTETAGAGLLDLIPADSVIVFDTYDATLLSGSIGGLVLLGPAIGSVFESIVFELENPGVPTPTPTPTPTPLPPPTADDLIAQAQPYIQQAEAMLGISLPELYGLINSEFAIAVFPPAESPTTNDFGSMVAPGFALWLQTSDPEQLLEVIERSRDGLSLLMGSPLSGAPAIQFETETVDGIEVTFIGIQGGGTRVVYGVFDDNILFVTTEDSLERVLNAASDDTSIAQTRAWHNDVYESFGAGQEALLFIDLSKYMSMTWSPYMTTPPPKVGQFIATADLADNGVFLLHATWLLEQ